MYDGVMVLSLAHPSLVEVVLALAAVALVVWLISKIR